MSANLKNKNGIEIFECNCAGCAPSPISIEGNDSGILDLSGSEKLKKVDCNVSNIKKINLSNCPMLEHVDCLYNELEEINLSNCTKLKSLNCYNNFLKEIDISDCKDLIFLDCSFNHLSEQSINNILFNLVKFRKTNGILKINGQDSVSFPSSGWEYLSILKSNGWIIECDN